MLAGCQTRAADSENTESTAIVQRKNVIVILIDDMGYADLSIYNDSTFYETPNIQALADRGVTFTDAYSASPVCSPSRAALMTGLYPTRLRATEWFHPPGRETNVERFAPAPFINNLPHETFTLAEAFRQDGYATLFLGKWHLGNDESHWPEHHGFDVNIGGHNFGRPRPGYFAPYDNPRLKTGPDGEYLTNRLTTEAIKQAKQHSASQQPYFMMLSYYSVHTPLQAPEETIAKYRARQVDLTRDQEFGQEYQHRLINRPRRVRVVQNHPVYAAMVEELDKNIGRLIDYLDAHGELENTIILLTSDNGGLSTAERLPTSNLPLRTGKGWLYEGGIRVPFILYADGLEANGKTVADPVMSIDIMPTLLGMSGVSIPQNHSLDGINVAASLSGDGLPERPLFFHYPHYSNQGGFPGAAVRMGQYKLLQNFEDGSIQLYDLEHDIGGRTDLSQRQPGIARNLSDQLRNWYDDTGAQFLQPSPTRPEAEQPWRPSR
uniref:Arylsulfatase n=1 Tax=Gracilariopsis lemaneiformis TaxID=2782 RepID=A0A291B083_GRALE|nr:arylsulfatase [Gracilariopsis lemaneiformis]